MRDQLRLVTTLTVICLTVAASGCARKNSFSPAPTAAVPAGAATVPAAATPAAQAAPAAAPELTLTDEQVALSGTWAGKLPATLIALGLDSSVLTAPVQADGRFRLPLDKGTSYVVALVPGSVARNGASLGLLPGAPGVARLKVASLGLDDLPMQKAEGPLELGTVARTGSLLVPGAGFDQAAFLAGLGMTASEAHLVGRWDDGTSLYSTLDADGDGRIDALAGRQPRLGVHYAWGREGNAGTLTSAVQDFVDLAAILRDDNYQSTTLVWTLPWSETLPPRAKLVFPAMSVCSDGDACGTDATQLSTDVVVDSDARAATAQLALAQRSDGTKPVPLEGDYGIDFGDGASYVFHDVRPRVIADDRGLAAPAVRLRAARGRLAGLDVAWQVNDPASGRYRLMTPDELTLLTTGSPTASAQMLCRDVMGQTVIDCRLPLTQVSGPVTGIACSQGWEGHEVDELGSCAITAQDIFGTVISYELFR